MFPLFMKPLNQLTWADVEELAAAKAPENQTTEFKTDLQVLDGTKNPWHGGAGNIGAYARDKIMKEIVAFANSSGGNLILGMAESKSGIKRAELPKPIPRCELLAVKLQQWCDGNIEPPLPTIEWQGITKSKDSDDGIVLARVMPSRLAPHRAKCESHYLTKDERSKLGKNKFPENTGTFYVRRGENSVPMTIREVRDSVLRSTNMFGVLEERLGSRRTVALDKLLRIQHQGGWSVYIGVIPTSGSVRIERPYRYERLFHKPKNFSAVAGADKCELNFPDSLGGIYLSRILPILGGARQEFRHSDRDSFVVREVHDDALVELLFKFQPPTVPQFSNVHLNWVLALVANTLLTADEARKLAGAPAAELAVELTLCTNGEGRIIGLSDSEGYALEQREVTLPRYIVGGPETIPETIKRIMNGLMESSHQPAIDNFSIDLG